MPYGIVVNSLCVLLGGFLGLLLKNRIPERFKDSLPMIFGLASMAMGITAIQMVHRLPAVAFAVITGFIAGEALQLEDGLTRALDKNLKKLKKDNDSVMDMNNLIAIIVLFCASGTGIYGAMESRFSGNHSILYTKSLLDFFTSAIFVTLLGGVVCLIAVPQFMTMFFIFLLAGVFMPYVSPETLLDFRACGGVIMLATGFRVARMMQISIVNMLPALILIIPISYLFSLIM